MVEGESLVLLRVRTMSDTDAFVEVGWVDAMMRDECCTGLAKLDWFGSVNIEDLRTSWMSKGSMIVAELGGSQMAWMMLKNWRIIEGIRMYIQEAVSRNGLQKISNISMFDIAIS